MTPPDVDTLSSELTVLAARLVRLIRRSHASSAGVRVLSILDELGPQSVTALAQADRCSQPTMTGQVRQLAEQGWVARKPNPTDARSSLITLTAAGRGELARVRGLSAALVAQRLAHHPHLSPDDLATAVAVLQAVVEPTSPTASTKGCT